MPNRDKEVGVWICAARSDPKGTHGQRRSLLEQFGDTAVITGSDRSEEGKQSRIVEVVGPPTFLRHAYRVHRRVRAAPSHAYSSLPAWRMRVT